MVFFNFFFLKLCIRYMTGTQNTVYPISSESISQATLGQVLHNSCRHLPNPLG